MHLELSENNLKMPREKIVNVKQHNLNNDLLKNKNKNNNDNIK